MRGYRPSPALVISLLALEIACAGTSVAASGVLIRNSHQVARGSITSDDLKNGHGVNMADLTAKARAALRGKRGPTGLAGPTGPIGLTGPPGSPAPPGKSIPLLFRASDGTGATVLFDSSGLKITASCNFMPGGFMHVTASATADNGVFMVSAVESNNNSDVDDDPDFDTGNTKDIYFSNGNFNGSSLVGTFVYIAADGTVITGDYHGKDRRGGVDTNQGDCVFGGTLQTG